MVSKTILYHCSLDWVLLRRDIQARKLFLALPLTPRHYCPQRQQGNVPAIRPPSFPHHHWHPIPARHRAWVALQRFRDGRNHLRIWHPLGLHHLPSLPTALSETGCVSRCVASVPRNHCRTHADHPLQEADWLLGQRTQVEQAWGQASRRQVRQHLAVWEAVHLGKH